MGKFLSIRNCDVADFAGVTEFSNNLARFGLGITNSSDDLVRLGVAGAFGRVGDVGAGMGTMFTPIVSIKWRFGAMKERRMDRSREFSAVQRRPSRVHRASMGPTVAPLVQKPI